MATTVNNAFSLFVSRIVDLDPEQARKARASRDNLKDNIHRLGGKNGFFDLASDNDLYFGSFSRKTKIRELDDIDMMIGMNGGDTTYIVNSWDDIKMCVKNSNSKFAHFCDQNGYISSTRVKNKFITELMRLNDYKKAEFHSRGEAVTLSLSSYIWVFDVVPCFKCSGIDKYLIPNGQGHWKYTNPRIEQDRITRINQKHNGKVLSTIRLVKYWNRRGKMPTLVSYVIETMVLDYFEKIDKTPDWIEQRFRDVLGYIKDNIWKSIHDSKGIEGDINTLSWDQKNALSRRALNDYQKATNAIYAELYEKDQRKAINIWHEIFGGDFPTYG